MLLGSRWKLRPADPPLATESGRPGGVLTPSRSQAGLPSARQLQVSDERTAEGEKSRENPVPQSRGPPRRGPGAAVERMRLIMRGGEGAARCPVEQTVETQVSADAGSAAPAVRQSDEP